MDKLENKYKDRIIGGLPGDTEYNCRQHFKQRLKERQNIEITDVVYYLLCEIAAKRSLISKEKGWKSPENPDRIFVSLSINYRKFDCLYDFMTGFLVTTLSMKKTKSKWTDLEIK